MNNEKSYLTPEEYKVFNKWYNTHGPGAEGFTATLYSIKHIEFPVNRKVTEEYGIEILDDPIKTMSMSGIYNSIYIKD